MQKLSHVFLTEIESAFDYETFGNLYWNRNQFAIIVTILTKRRKTFTNTIIYLWIPAKYVELGLRYQERSWCDDTT